MTLTCLQKMDMQHHNSLTCDLHTAESHPAEHHPESGADGGREGVSEAVEVTDVMKRGAGCPDRKAILTQFQLHRRTSGPTIQRLVLVV